MIFEKLLMVYGGFCAPAANGINFPNIMENGTVSIGFICDGRSVVCSVKFWKHLLRRNQKTPFAPLMLRISKSIKTHVDIRPSLKNEPLEKQREAEIAKCTLA